MGASTLHTKLPAAGRTLQSMLLVFCAVVLAAIWVGLFHLLAFERDSAVERREAENDNLARVFAEQVRRQLAAASVDLKQLEADYRRHGAKLDLARLPRDTLAPYPVLAVVDRDGDLVTASVPLENRPNFRNTDNFRFHLSDPSEEIHVAKPRPGLVVQTPTNFLSRRVSNPDGSFGGMTMVGTDPLYLSAFYDQIELGEGAVVVLMGLDGIVRSRRSSRDTSKGAPGADMRGTTLFREHLPRAAHGRFRTASPSDGVARLCSYRSVQGHPLVVLIDTSEAATLAAFERQKRIYLHAAGFISVVICALALLVSLQIRRQTRIAQDLRASEERHILVERATSDGIWDRNLRTGEAYLSPRGKEILGYAPDDPQGAAGPLFDQVHPEDSGMVRDALMRSVQEGAPYRLEYRLRHAGGGYRWVLSRGEIVRNDRGEPTRMIGSITDITERRESEKHIREQARLLDLIFRHSLDSIVLLDRNYNFVRVSDTYARACQREVSDFLGQNHFALYPSDFEAELEPYRREKKIYSAVARPFVFPDHPEWGTTYWDLGLVPILGRDDEIELFLFTLKDVTGRVRAEAKTIDYMTRMRALSGRVVALQEEERRALARELHDEIGQDLTAIKVRLQAMAQAGERGVALPPAEILESALATVAKILDQVRSLSLNLRPTLLDDFGLPVALPALLQRNAAAAGWSTRFNDDMPQERFEAGLEIACYRVAQEALTNVMRHAGAKQVSVTLRRSGGTLSLVVRDDGRGFDLASARATTGDSHLGLLGMEERVKNMAGLFEIRTARGRGTEVLASFPIINAAVAASAVAP